MKWPRVPQWVYVTPFLILAYGLLISLGAMKSITNFPLSLWLIIFIFAFIAQMGVKMIHRAKASRLYMERAIFVGFGYGISVFIPMTYMAEIRNSLQRGYGVLYSFNDSIQVHLYNFSFFFIGSILVGLIVAFKKTENK